MKRRSSSVTIREVAREAGVSVATVSRYINQSARVSDGVAERIDLAINDLKYVPSAAARQLASQRTKVIGLLLTNMHNDFFAPLVSGIEVAVQKEGYSLLVATHQTDSHPDVDLPIGPHNTDGMIVFADSLSDGEIGYLHQLSFPMILIHRSSPNDYQIPSVTIENKNATRRLIEHLITVHERKKIVYLCGPANQEDSKWREIGYKQALEAHGILFDNDLVLCGGFERETGYAEMKEFLAKKPDFDAVFAWDDDSAIGVLSALKEGGYQLPEEVSVVGFNDLRLSPFLTPPLTTIKAPTELVGATAAKKLFDLLSGKSIDVETLLPTEIIIRRSCGCHA